MKYITIKYYSYISYRWKYILKSLILENIFIIFEKYTEYIYYNRYRFVLRYYGDYEDMYFCIEIYNNIHKHETLIYDEKILYNDFISMNNNYDKFIMDIKKTINI